jgi:hypothetical protein
MAMLFASVPPDVNASLYGVRSDLQRYNRILCRTPSTSARQTRPMVCSEFGLPTGARDMASTTTGSMMLAAAESK